MSCPVFGWADPHEFFKCSSEISMVFKADANTNGFDALLAHNEVLTSGGNFCLQDEFLGGDPHVFLEHAL